MSKQRFPSQVAGPRTLKGSVEAKRTAAVLLESIAGVYGADEASARLGVALPRYYVLETRALQGLISALEPLARGRQKTIESHEIELSRENTRLKREVHRYQALHRVAQKALGLAPPQQRAADSKGRKKRRTRRRTRAERVVEVLRADATVAASQDPPPREAGEGAAMEVAS